MSTENNDLGFVSSGDIMEVISKDFFLFRNVQAMCYMKKNPPSFSNPVESYPTGDVFQYIHSYIIDIMKKFFPGLGIFYCPNDDNYEDSNIFEMYLHCPMTQENTRINFTVFMTALERTLTEFLKDSSIHLNYVRCDGQSLRIECEIFYETENENYKEYIHSGDEDAIYI